MTQSAAPISYIVGIGATRLGDFVQSYCQNVPSGPFVQASTNTFIDGRGQVRLGDKAVPGIAVSGSKATFVDGRPAVRLRDKVICGVITQSSKNTFIA